MMIRGFCQVVELGAVLSARFSKSSMGGGGTQLGPAPAADGNGNGGVLKLRGSLGPSTHLVIQKGDLTKWFVDHSSDAIVNAADERMLGGGGVDGAIHRAAGPELLQACYDVPEVKPGVRCPVGEARITIGFRLPASHVVHTVGPVYDVSSFPEAFLRNAYRNSMRVAKENNIQYIAFPAISCGAYGYPFEEAATIALSTIEEFADDFKEVHFVLFNEDTYNVWLEKASGLLKSPCESTVTKAKTAHI